MCFCFYIKNGILCVLIRIASVRREHITYLHVIENQRGPYHKSGPGAIINPHWLELSLSQTNFNGPKDVRAIEVRLYLVSFVSFLSSFLSFFFLI